MAVLISSLAIILAPLYIIRMEWVLPTTLLELLVILAILTNVTQFIKDGLPLKKLRTHFDTRLVLFLATALLATFVSSDFVGGLGILKAYFVEPALFFYCLVFQARKRGNNFITFSLILAGTWLSILGILQKVTGSFTLAPYETAQGRISAVYNSANSLALFLGPITILCLGEVVRIKGRMKLLWLMLFILFTLVLVWTRSRGGMIAQLGALAIFAYTALALANRLIRKFWFVLPTIFLILVASFLYLFYLNYNFLPIKNGKPYTQGDTLQIRYFIWAGTVNMLRDHPIFGAGLNGFKTLYTNQYRLPQFQEEFQYPHNLLLTFWAETGLLGLFAFLSILVGALGLIIRTLRRTPQPIFGATLIAVIFYWMIHGVVDVPYFKNDLSLEFWTILALVEVYAQPKARK